MSSRQQNGLKWKRMITPTKRGIKLLKSYLGISLHPYPIKPFELYQQLACFKLNQTFYAITWNAISKII